MWILSLNQPDLCGMEWCNVVHSDDEVFVLAVNVIVRAHKPVKVSTAEERGLSPENFAIVLKALFCIDNTK